MKTRSSGRFGGASERCQGGHGGPAALHGRLRAAVTAVIRSGGEAPACPNPCPGTRIRVLARLRFTGLGDVDTLLPFCRRHVRRGSFASSHSVVGDTFLTSA